VAARGCDASGFKEAIMREATTKGGTTFTVILAALALLAASANAQTVPFPRLARYYITWMARAMDQCTAPTLSVVNPPGEPPACPQVNGTTDNTITMGFARLAVTSRGRIGLFVTGLPFTARVRIQLTLRVTRNVTTVKHPPGSNKRVTFQDVTIQCPPPATSPFGLVASGRGAIAARMTLESCLTNTALATGNIEILNSALLDIDNGNKVFAVPGILR
jgi:hypothetical protein